MNRNILLAVAEDVTAMNNFCLTCIDRKVVLTIVECILHAYSTEKINFYSLH